MHTYMYTHIHVWTHKHTCETEWGGGAGWSTFLGQDRSSVKDSHCFQQEERGGQGPFEKEQWGRGMTEISVRAGTMSSSQTQRLSIQPGSQPTQQKVVERMNQ